MYCVAAWVLITNDIEFFSMMIPGFISAWITYYLIVNQYLPIYL